MVIQADIQCTNGVIHVINRVLAPAGPPPPFKMVAIEGGVFIMGSNKPGESPPREVRISSFLIGKYEVTRGKYYEIMGVDPSYDKPQFQFSGQWENLPVQHVTWYDAVEFCNAMSKAEGYTPYYSVTVQAGGKKVVQVLDPEGNGYRLPTEAEWEYACRAGTSTDFCCGNSSSVLDGYAWHRQNLPVGPPGPQPFGSKLPNAWDLHDMHGNVQEWCQDWFTRPYPAWTGAGPEPDPRGPLSGSPVPAKVLRGGSYVTPPDLCRSTFRTSAASPGNGKDDYRHAAIGFRLARTPKGGTSP
jgi:formylglycine-generating enzyme required for sulfatase activity